MLVSSSSSALTGPGFFLAGIPAAAGCGEAAAAADEEEEEGLILTPPSGSGNAGADVEDGGGGPEGTENVISGQFEDMFTG